MNPRFGPFEVDLEGRRLLKSGKAITLREQSFQVLAALMERPGEIVTREELRKRLWPSDTFVDFEVALNSAVSRLRDALGDSAGSPSVIETIPKRGYRFVVPIPKQPAVAVMPFANQTGDANDEYFSDGLTDELIRVLSRIEGLRVTAPSVVFRFKGQTSRCQTSWPGTGRRSGTGGIGLEIRRPHSRHRQPGRCEGWIQSVGTALRRQPRRRVRHSGSGLCCGSGGAERASGIARSGKPSRNMTAYVQYLKGCLPSEEATAGRCATSFRVLSGGNPSWSPVTPSLITVRPCIYIVSAAYSERCLPVTALSEAEDLVAKGLALDENSVMLHSRWECCGCSNGVGPNRKQAHRRAISLEPANAFPHMMWPFFMQFLGRHDEAVFACRQVRRARSAGFDDELPSTAG